MWAVRVTHYGEMVVGDGGAGGGDAATQPDNVIEMTVQNQEILKTVEMLKCTNTHQMHPICCSGKVNVITQIEKTVTKFCSTKYKLYCIVYSTKVCKVGHYCELIELG